MEQIDKRFDGVPRDQLDDIIDVYNGVKPISEAELGHNTTTLEATEIHEIPKNDALKK